MNFICPMCGSNMIYKEGPKVNFYGCVSYPQTYCPGKRDLEGHIWGCDGVRMSHLEGQSYRMFDTWPYDGLSCKEYEEIDAEWQRQEENDCW